MVNKKIKKNKNKLSKEYIIKINDYKVTYTNEMNINIKNSVEFIGIKGKYKINNITYKLGESIFIYINEFNPFIKIENYKKDSLNNDLLDLMNVKDDPNYNFIFFIKDINNEICKNDKYFRFDNLDFNFLFNKFEKIYYNKNDKKINIIVFGEKNTGKSTLVNILLNKFKKNFKNVFLTDLDWGQSLTSFPGMVYLKKWNKNIIVNSSNIYNNLDELEKCFYIGELTYNNFTKSYLDSIKKIKDHLNSYDNFINIINLNGFIKSVGGIIYDEVFNIINPEIKILMGDNDFGFNYNINYNFNINNLKKSQNKIEIRNRVYLNLFLKSTKDLRIKINLTNFLVLGNYMENKITDFFKIIMIFLKSLVFLKFKKNNEIFYSYGFIQNVENDEFIIKISNQISNYDDLLIIKSNIIDLPEEYFLKNNVNFRNSLTFKNDSLIGMKPYKSKNKS